MNPNELPILSPFYVENTSHVRNRNTKISLHTVPQIFILHFALFGENQLFSNISEKHLSHQSKKQRKLEPENCSVHGYLHLSLFLA